MYSSLNMIIACYECNGKVSTGAKACPHCGAPVRDDSNWKSVAEDPGAGSEPGPSQPVAQAFSEIEPYRPCPFCGKQVNSDAAQCMACLKDIVGCLKVICPRCADEGVSQEKWTNTICDRCQYEFDTFDAASVAVNKMLRRNRHLKARQRILGPVKVGAKCPSCKSTNSEKAGPTGGEIGRALVVGLLTDDENDPARFLSSTRHRWRCRNCAMIWMA